MFIIDKEEFKYVDTDATETKSELDPGVYNVHIYKSFFGGKSISFTKNLSHTKGTIADAGVFSKIKNYLLDYWSDAAKICRKEMSLPTRMGLLFKGEPGTGKTYTAVKLAQSLVEMEGAIAVVTSKVSNLDLPETVDILRRGNPDKLIILVWDEFEKDWEDCDKTKILSFLDGTNSRDNVLVIATVNNEKKLPGTLLDRPGRFELIEDFKIESKEIALNIITAMIPEHRRDLIKVDNIYTSLPKKFTIDNIKVAVRNAVTKVIQLELAV